MTRGSGNARAACTVCATRWSRSVTCAGTLAETRARGYSIDDENVRQGVYCLAAPVHGVSGEAVAGLGVCMQMAGLKPRFVAQQPDTVIDLACRLSEQMGATPEARSK